MRETCEHVAAIEKDLCTPTRSVADLALQFCLANNAISTVIPGMRRPEHVRANLAAAAQPALSADDLTRCRTHRWVRNFYPTHG